MTPRAWLVCAALTVAAAPLVAQTNGAIIGHVRQRDGGQPVSGAEIGVDGRWLDRSDSTGFYRLREVRSGWHVVTMRAIGFDTVPARWR